jgi:hypothetical protein
MSQLKGHWFCAGKCNDTVTLPKPSGRWDSKRGVTCPVCHQPTANWVPDAPVLVAPERGRYLFAQLKEAIQ